MITHPRKTVESLLSHADVRICGDRPRDPQIHNDNFYKRVLAEGSLGLGESYMDGWWDCESLDEFFCAVLRAELDSRARLGESLFHILSYRLINLQKPARAFEIAKRHYNIGNELFRCMLGERMIYSCGYWKEASSLDEAQDAKLELVCRKLDLRPGMKVLDIGCGWGGSARFAAERCGVEVLGITVSEEQVKLAIEKCRGLPIEFRLQDYRSLEGTFDRIFSLGMFEHVGLKNYADFFRIVRKCLKEDGLFLLHTIGGNESVFRNDPWIERYVFPNSMLPSAGQICSGIEGVFVLEDWHGFGADYDRTLMEWYRRFEENWDSLKKSYDERFYRMWKYYLLSSAGAFRARKNQLWQIVLSPHGVPQGYASVR